MQKNLPVPRKRASGLIITARSLANVKTPLGAGIFYAVFTAFVIGLVYPTMSKFNLDGYLTSSAVAGLLGAKLQHASNFSALIALELYGAFYGLLFGGIVAYIAGAALPATIENGTLDLALARPISRTRYYLEIWLSAILAGIILSVLTAASVWLSTLFVNNAGVSWQWLIITQLIEFTFFVFATGIGMLFGSFMNASRAAGGAAVGIIGLAYLMNTIGIISDKLNWMLHIEPFYYTPGVQALAAHSFTEWHPWVPVIAGLVCTIAGLVIFNKRDLPTV